MTTYECPECGYEQELAGRCPECDVELEAQETEEVVAGGELAGADELVKEEESPWGLADEEEAASDTDLEEDVL